MKKESLSRHGRSHQAKERVDVDMKAMTRIGKSRWKEYFSKKGLARCKEQLEAEFTLSRPLSGVLAMLFIPCTG